ncbi:MAG: alpha/beta hydrolase [Kofleriaceae bacterium]|nr:alpha/beta hydrolase [Kofleriaceae bacterium]
MSVRPWFPALALAAIACGGAQNQPAKDDDGPFVNRAGFKPTSFTVEVHGEGRPIIFIPGLGCPGDVFDDIVDHLGDRYESHVLTLAGFAGVPAIRPPLAAKVRHEIIRYIRSNKLEAPIIVGHSMGGFIAYWLAVTAPDAIGGIVVIDAGPGLEGDSEDARLLRNTWAQAGDDELPIQIRNVFTSMTRHPKRIEPYLADIARSDRQAIGDAIYELVKTDVSDQVDTISVPSLIVLADGGLQNRYKKQVADIPGHQVVVIPKTGHFVWLDDLDGFDRALDKFLAKRSE